jgi:hypothetical protein
MGAFDGLRRGGALMLRECDRETVESLVGQFLEIIRDFQQSCSGMNPELLNAIAIGAALVLASLDDAAMRDEARSFFLLALDNQIADFRRELAGG